MRATSNQVDRRERRGGKSRGRQRERGQTMKHESRGRKKFDPTVSGSSLADEKKRL